MATPPPIPSPPPSTTPSAAPAAAPPPRGRGPAWMPGRRVWLWIVPAFLIGLVLFILMIRDKEGDDFFRAGGEPAADDRAYAPLPAPLPAGEGAGIEPLPAPPAVAERPVAPPPPPPVAETEPRREQPADEPARPRAIADSKPRPIPGETPAPTYPPRSVMRGEGGTTLVIAHIGPDGVPTAVEIAQSSGSRDLDRAAAQAVRRWRFEPAIADGRPTVGKVIVPIDFRP